MIERGELERRPFRAAVRLAVLACLALLAVRAAADAHAANGIYWGDGENDMIRVGNLDGSGAPSTLFTEPAGDEPNGVVLDPAAGRIYWTNAIPDDIRAANLDGSGMPFTLFDQPAGIPRGVAIDPVAGKIYWANAGNETIRVGNLDGSGGFSTLFTEAAGSTPVGVTIDPVAGKIYWGNFGTRTIRVANLDGSGTPSTLFTELPTNRVGGVAIDPAGGKIYWATIDPNEIRVANLDGSGTPSTLFTEGANTDPFGVAIDPLAGKLYWANLASDEIRVGNLDGSGAATLFAGETEPRFVALLHVPAGAGAPVISGGGQLGQPLSCTRGMWAPNLLGGFLYRVPHTFAFQWLRDGSAIPGATGNTHTPTEPGSYACRVTATNQAGSTAQTSAAVQVIVSSDFRFAKVRRNRKKGIAFLTVIVPGAGQIGYRGKGEAKAASSGAIISRPVRAAGRLRMKIKAGRFGKRAKRIRRQLKRGSGRAKVKVFVTFVPAGGTPRTKAKRLKLVRK